MYYVTGLLNHLKSIKVCMAELGGSAAVNASDLSLDIRIGAETCHFFPQFVSFKGSRRIYSPVFTDDVRAFIGWRPYRARGWPATADKLLFKGLARDTGARVPPDWEQSGGNIERVIVKQRRSSFGDGIRGPFERINVASREHQLEAGEYYESFIPGRIAKAWYLNGELLALELRPPPFLTGDGRATILELAMARSLRTLDERALSWIVGAQGHRPQDVLELGARVVVDFRYGSPYEIGSYLNENVYETLRDTEIGRQFQRAGYSLLPAIPAEMRHDTLVTLDAIVDEDDSVWFLEINSNPAVHPDAYPSLLRAAFEPGVLLPIAAS